MGRKKQLQNLKSNCETGTRLLELILGNGHEGMARKVERHDKILYEWGGAIALVKWLMPPIAVVAVINLIITIFGMVD